MLIFQLFAKIVKVIYNSTHFYEHTRRHQYNTLRKCFCGSINSYFLYMKSCMHNPKQNTNFTIIALSLIIFSGLFKFNFFLGDDRVGVNNLSKRTVFFGDFVGVLKNTGSGAAVNKNQ